MYWRLPCKDGACAEETNARLMLLAKEVEPSLREFSLAAASLADSVGIALADICGILVQVWLQLPTVIDFVRG
jgi:hypothetical protein